MHSRFEHTVGAIMIALVAGAVSSFITYPVLLWVGARTGVIKIVFFGPRPEAPPWILPTLIGGSITVGGIVAWLTFWLLDRKI